MSGREFVAEPDRWTLPRRQTFGLRSPRILPGPLKALPQRRGSPVRWAGLVGCGLAGLALAVVILAPRPAATGSSEPVRTVAPQAAVDMPTPRVVGAVPMPAAPAAPTSEPPVLRTAGAEPESVPLASPPAVRRPAAPSLDLGQLPVLELDASAFEPPAVAEPPRPAARAPTRPPSSRLAVQP